MLLFGQKGFFGKQQMIFLPGAIITHHGTKELKGTFQYSYEGKKIISSFL